MGSEQSNESEIRQKLAELPRRNMKCDLVLQVGDHSFMANKDVLMLRMEYFRGMFNANMQEKDMAFIKLDPAIVDPAVFDEILDYVYTLNIEFKPENLESIYKAVDFFCFDELKAKTEQFMKSNINMDNVACFLDIAVKFNLKNQEGQCKKFIISNPLLDSKALPAVGYLNFTELSSLLRKLSSLSKFEEMFHSSMAWILHDEQNRSTRVFDLLQNIPLGLLSSDFHEKVISKNTLVINNMKCLQLLYSSIIANPLIEELFVFSDMNGTGYESSMSTYDSSRQQWSEISPMPKGVRNFACCVANQTIYVCGGIGDRIGYRNELYMYDPNTHQWNTLNAMKQPREGCTMAFLDGHLYVAGGFGDTDLYPSGQSIVERYSIQNDEWTTVSPMIHKRRVLELVQMNGLLYALGGHDGKTYHRSVEQYNPLTDKWTLIANMNGYSRYSSAVLNNRIYAAGNDSCEEYNPEENQWRKMPSPTKSEYGRRLAVIDGKLYAIAGGITQRSDSKGIKFVEYYDFEKRSWKTAKDTNIARSHHGVAVITRKHIQTPA